MENEHDETTTNNLFPTIGNRKLLKKIKVKPNLPKWIDECTNYSGDLEKDSIDIENIENLIDKCLYENLKKININKLFPVQKIIIPKLIDCLMKKNYFQPNDICIISPTGSGKTFAYSIPIIQYLLLNRIITELRVLIILPVQDLANQVYKVFQKLCENTTIRLGLATGSTTTSTSTSSNSSSFYKLNSDKTKLLCQIDILIATPGKLVDLINDNDNEETKFHLKNLEILIIDEADRMMNETQIQWLKIIEKNLYNSNEKYYCQCLIDNNNDNKKQFYNVDPYCLCSKLLLSTMNEKRTIFKILFSATFSIDPEKIDDLSLYNPVMINMKNNIINNNNDNNDNKLIKTNNQTYSLPKNLKEFMIIIDLDKKPLILWYLIKKLNYKQILCFTNSIINTHRLVQLMKCLPELIVYELHSKQNIHKRTKILKKFENKKIDILISTDVTARGMDINDIDCVVSYDLPRNEIAYIHRIGRTARAGKQGTAITILSPDQLKHFNIIRRRSHSNNTKDDDNDNESNNKIIEKLSIKQSDLSSLMPIYKNALKQLKNDAKNERKKDLISKRKQLLNKLSF